MSRKPGVGARLNSSKTGKSAAVPIVQRRPEPELASRSAVASRVALIVLLGCAAIGLVFTFKHRSRPVVQAPAVVESDGGLTFASGHPDGKSPPPRAAARRSTKPSPSVEVLPLPKPIAEQASVRPPGAAVKPKTKPDASQPGAGVAKKPPFEATGPPSVYEETPTVIEDKVRPGGPAARKLPPTEAPSANADERIGTKITFLTDVRDAFVEAKKAKNKLVLLISYSGPIRNGAFVSTKAEQFRKECLLNDAVADFVREQGFVCVLNHIDLPEQPGGETRGTVVTYFCESDKSVLHAIGGPVDAAEFLKQAHWLVDLRDKVLAESKGDAQVYAKRFRDAHQRKYEEHKERQGETGLPRAQRGQGAPFNPRSIIPQAGTQGEIHRLLSKWSKGLPKLDSHLSAKIYFEIMEGSLQ